MVAAIRGRLVAAIFVLCAGLLPAGCGSSSSGSGEGTLRGTTSIFPDSLDPALTMSQEGWSALSSTYLPLLTYPRAEGREGTELVPGLARALPEVSEDGRTYSLRLREGLRYSDGTPVRASDFRHSIERVLALNAYASSYYTDIVGAERFQETGRGGIPGIETDDESGEITVRLRAPRGTFPYELATLSAAVLPSSTPVEDMTKSPPPGTGPYEIAGVKPGREWSYDRNPEWDGNNDELLPQISEGEFDRIRIGVVTNPQTQVAEVERGEADWMVNPPAPDQLADLKRRFEGTQLRNTELVGVFYFWMNTAEPPFDDVRVRRAVNHAIAPAALERIYAGQVNPLQQVLPPAMPGHEPFVLYPHDLRRAKELIAAANPSDRAVTVWTNNFPTNQEAGEYYEGVLREIGLEPKLKVLNTTNYFTVVSNLNTPDLDTGWGNWLLEYPHPNSYFEPQLTRAGISETGNTNWSLFDDPGLSDEVRRLRSEQLGPEQEEAYAALDRAYMREAPWAPYGTLEVATLVADTIDLDELVISPIYGQELTSFEPAK